MNITPEQYDAIAAKVASIEGITVGIGSEHAACTIAAINLALSGKLTDEIPDCMSLAIGNAAIPLQDAMPAELRNSQRYRNLIPLMAGTGRDPETEKRRSAVILDWMWNIVLPQLQPFADTRGFGDEWRRMCRGRSRDTTYAACAVTYAAYAAYYLVADAAYNAAKYGCSASTYAATTAAYANATYYDATGKETFWNAVDPVGVLERMVAA